MTEPKRIGRPPVADPFKSVTIQLRASDLETITRLAEKDWIGVSTWVRGACIAALRQPTPAQMAPVRAATERKIQDAISSFRPHPKAGKRG